MERFNPKALFRELRRRRVFNTVAIYIVGAWVALQVAELALPALEIPDRAIRYVWLASFALFPLVLLFGWRYDISTGGVRKTPPADTPPDADERLQHGDHWYVGGLFLLSVAVIAWSLLRIGQTEPEVVELLTPADLSLAVLPFEVCAEAPGDRPLADELTEEVRSRLAERSTLKVIMRTSTEQLTAFDLPRKVIAGHLGVEYLLSAVVCRRDNALVVTSKLNDRDDYIKLQERYEQGVNNFGQIDSPVASQMAGDVARALGVAFDPVTETPVNSLAWEQVLLSRHLARSDNIEAAVKAIDRALEYQPDFPQTLAWKALYTTREIGRDEMTMNPEKAIGLAEAALKGVHRQIEFGANNAQTQFVAGFINHELGHWTEMLIPSLAAEGNSQAAGELRSQARERFLQAEKHFRTVRTLNPSFTGFGGLNIYSYLAGTLEHLGKDRRNEALEIYEAGVEVEPWSQWFNASLAQRRAARGRYREAMELLDRFRQLPDVPIGIWSARREIVLSLGYFDENCEGQLWIRQNEPEKLAPGLETRTGYITFFSRVLPYLGLEQETRDFLARFADIEEKPGHTLDHEYVFDRRTDEQILQLELLFNEGHPDEARPVLEELRRHLETEHDIGIRHPQTLRYLAETYAFLGRDEEALAMLKKAVDYHLRRNDFDEWDRLHSPWSRLREDPRFTAQWNRMARDLQQQAETIRAMLSRYDMGELVAPLKVEETK